MFGATTISGRAVQKGARILMVGLAVSSCSMAPDFKIPEHRIPGNFRQNQPMADALPMPTGKWWEAFGSPELNALEERALANNFELKGAILRVAQAQAQAEAAGAALLPSISAHAGQSLDGPDLGVGEPIRYGHDQGYSKRLYKAGFRTSYEVDLWGKNKLSSESALALAEGSEYDRRTVTLSLVSMVANNYFLYLLAQDRVKTARENAANSRRSLDVLVQRASIQEATSIQIAQQRAVVSRLEAAVPALEMQREQVKDLLGLLLGTTGAGLEITGQSVTEVTVPVVQPGLPSELLTRRPDIGKVEAQLRAANANIGIARANFLPSFGLSGEAGQGSPFLASLLSPAGLYYTLASSLSQTIFDGGRNEAALASSKARYEELVQTYRQAVLNALRDVDDTLFSNYYLARQEEADRATAAAARQAYDYSSKALAGGQIDYMTLLESERSLYQAEDTLVQTRYARLTAANGLMRALGGDPAEIAKPVAAVSVP